MTQGNTGEHRHDTGMTQGSTREHRRDTGEHRHDTGEPAQHTFLRCIAESV